MGKNLGGQRAVSGASWTRLRRVLDVSWGVLDATWVHLEASSVHMGRLLDRLGWVLERRWGVLGTLQRDQVRCNDFWSNFHLFFNRCSFDF